MIIRGSATSATQYYAAIISSDGGSEGIADGQMEGQGVAERRHVVVAFAAGVVRGMDAYAEVGANDEDVDVEPQAGACAEREVAQERRSAQAAARTQFVVLEQPYVACVEEYCTVQGTEDGEAQLGVSLELECARAVEILLGRAFRGAVAAGADAAHRECTDAVGSAYIELLGVRNFGGVAVGMRCSGRHAADEPYVSGGDASAPHELHLSLDKLGERCAEQPFLSLAAACAVYCPE